MKLLNKFKNKKFVKLFSIIVLSSVALISSGTILLTSYAEWSTYYNAIMDEKKEQDEIQKMPLQFKGIDANLSDLVRYYKNGKAAPKSDDFIVMAKFTEKGKEFSKRLKSEEYSVNVPDNFALFGGEVEIKYTYYDEKDNKTIESTTKVKVELTDILLSNLNLIENPYKIYYREGDIFDPSGLKCKGICNDGSVIDIYSSDITFEQKPLMAGTNKMLIKYDNVETEIDIQVVASDEYNEGDITSIKVEGEVYVEEGQEINDSIDIFVRGTYESGNRYILDDSKYTVNAKGTPLSTEPCIITVSLNDIPEISTDYLTYVQKSYEAESATLIGLTTTIHNGIESVKATNNGKVKYVINAEKLTKSDLTIRIANRSNSNISLNKIMTMRVNNRLVGVPSKSIILGEDKSSNTNGFYNYKLAGVLLNAGSNVVELSFSNINNEDFVIDKISTVSGGSGTIDNSLSYYLEDCINKEKTPTLDIKMVQDWNTLPTKYAHGLCNDGKYIYGITTITHGANPRGVYVYRYDPSGEKTLVKSSVLNSFATENTSGITYYDGKIVIFSSNGKMMATDTTTFDEGSKFVEFTGFEFAGLDNKVITDVYYNASLKKYAVTELTSGKFSIRIYDKNKETYIDLPLKTISEGNYSRLTGNNKYIYITHKKDGLYTPVLQVYDWSGNYVGKTTIPNNPSDFSATDTQAKKTNSQGVTFLGDTMYFTMSRWYDALDSGCLLKASKADKGITINGEGSQAVALEYSLGEYVDVNSNSSLNISSSVIDEGEFPISGTISDVICDGNYYYTSINDTPLSTVIYKIDPKTKAILAISKKIYLDNSHSQNGSKLFIKDNILYCASTSGELFYIKLNDFVTDCKLILVDKNTIERNDIIPFYDDLHYENSLNKFVAISHVKKTLSIFSSSGSIEKTIDLSVIYDSIRNQMNSQENFNKLLIASVTGDEKYIYLTFTSEGQNTIPLIIFDYEGNQIGELIEIDMNNISMVGKYDVQNAFVYENKVYLTLRSLENRGSYIWTINYTRNI